MEHTILFQLSPGTLSGLLTAIRDGEEIAAESGTFSGLPAGVVFSPNLQHPGSLHYMFFPPGNEQRMHYHDGNRDLIIVGDVDMIVSYSRVAISESPFGDLRTLIVPKNAISAVRLPAFCWHRFGTSDEEGTGVIAFSFHDKDELPNDYRPTDRMMEDMTVFWDGSEGANS